MRRSPGIFMPKGVLKKSRNLYAVWGSLGISRNLDLLKGSLEARKHVTVPVFGVGLYAHSEQFSVRFVT